MMSNVHFLTGLPAFASRRFLPALLARDPAASVFLLVPPQGGEEQRHQLLACLSVEEQERLTLLEGLGDHMHFGLSSAEYRHLRDRATHLHHLGGDEPSSQAAELKRRSATTANVVELSRAAKRLERLSHLSSVRVAGDRRGLLQEEELAVGQRFRKPADAACFRSELMVQRLRNTLPVTVFRPSTVIGDSRTGELSRSDLPLHLAFGLALPPWSLPLRALGVPIPFQVVPSDYVCEAMVELSQNPEAAGRTFHLVDPAPMSARRVWEQISSKVGAPPSLFAWSAWLAGLPLLDKLFLGEESGGATAGLRFSLRNTQALLDAKGLRCPPLHSYLDRLIRWAQKHGARQLSGLGLGSSSETEDALELS